MVHWIEDEEGILTMLQTILKDMFPNSLDNIVIYRSWRNVRPVKGDLVLHDLVGVGVMPEKVDGVTYLSCSGSCKPSDNVDISKPFDFGKLEELLEPYLNKP